MIYFVYFLILLSFFDMFSQLPIMSTYALDLGASTMMIGFIVGAYSFSNMISNVFSGYFVDRYGPKIFLTAGFLSTGLILFLYSTAASGGQLFAVRLLHGISAGILVPAAFTYVSIMNKKRKSGQSMAISGAAVGFAAIFGPAFGGIVADMYGAEWVFRIIGIAMILAGIITGFILSSAKKEIGEKISERHSLRNYLTLFKNRGLLFAYFGALSLMFSQGILAYMLPLKVDGLDLGSNVSGMLISTFGIVAILFFLLPTNRIFDLYKNEFILVIGMMIISVSLVFLSFTSSLTLMYVLMGIYGTGFALLFPSISSLITIYSTKEERGKAFGLFYGFFSLGVVLGSSITGAFSMTPFGAFLTAAFALGFVSLSILVIELKNQASDALKEKEDTF